MTLELRVPAVGESITEVEIGEWLKVEGERVRREDALVMIETDKVTVELPAPADGVLSKILVRKGQSALVGEVIGILEEAVRSTEAGTAAQRAVGAVPTPGQGAAPATAAASAAAPAGGAVAAAVGAVTQAAVQAAAQAAATSEASAARTGGSAASETGALGHVMPSAARALHDAGLSLRAVEATGPGGRVLKEDVVRAGAHRPATPPPAEPAPAPAPRGTTPAPMTASTGASAAASSGAASRASSGAPSGTSPGAAGGAAAPAPAAGLLESGAREEEVVPMTPLRRRVAERLVQAQQSAALLTTFNEVDMSAVMELRAHHQEAFQARYGIKLGFMSFFVKAAVDALRLVPQVNAEVRGTDIVYRNYFDIGVAVGGGRGLVVPVLRNAERLGFAQVEQAIAELAARAKKNTLRVDELQGGTFTVSNGGVYGSMLSTPIVNPPQSGILGLHAIQERPVARGGQVVIRPMMYLALTYDHRIVDGREAVTFLKRIKEGVEEPTRLLLEV